MIALHFPDGSILKARTSSQAISLWRERQWHELDDGGWRAELAKRAYIWSDTIVNPKAPSAEFLRQLEDAGLVKLVRS